MVGLAAVEDAETGDGARGTADPSLALEDGGQGELARLRRGSRRYSRS